MNVVKREMAVASSAQTQLDLLCAVATLATDWILIDTPAMVYN